MADEATEQGSGAALDAAFADTLRSFDSLDPALLADLRKGTRSAMQAEDARPLGKVRAMSTTWRVGLSFVVLAALSAFALVGASANRPAVVAFGVLAAGSFWLALRPMHKAPAPPFVVYGLPALATVLTLVVGFMAPSSAATPLPQHLGCFAPGLGVGLVLLGLLRMLSRGPLGFVPFAAAAGAGLTANAFLSGRCHVDPTIGHLLLGHGSVLFVLLLAAALAGLTRAK